MKKIIALSYMVSVGMHKNNTKYFATVPRKITLKNAK